jgi:hypothetical protein
MQERNILAAFARFAKGLNLAVTSVRYFVIMVGEWEVARCGDR